MTSLGFPEQQGIQRFGATWQPQRHAGADDQQWPQPRVTSAVETAEIPERQRAQGRVIRQISEQPHRRTGQRRQCDARQQHGRDVGLAITATQSIHQRRHAEAAEKRADRQQIRPEPFRQAAKKSTADNRNRCAQCRAAGNTDQSRIGQRITKQALHRHAGQRQHTAHCQSQQRSRQTNLPKDQFSLLQSVRCQRHTKHA
ncbi:hypothetical protein D3C72_1388330 [compost metagenome]